MPFRTETVRNGVYVELVRSLYTTLIPTTIMSIGYVASFSVMGISSQNPVLVIFAAIGVFSSIARIAVLVSGSAEASDSHLTIERARQLDRRFAISYYQFAVLLGVSAACVFTVEAPRFHMLATCLLVGYGAGVAAGVGLRPWIAIPSMLVAIAPSIIVMALRWDPIYWVLAAMTAALLVGGCQSLPARHRVTSVEIAKRLTFEALARRDVLTTLPNRLALREWFESHVAIGGGHELLAVHCLDLNDFKPVNDVFGHPIGDALLKAVAMRLTQALRVGDIAARLGGDEFAVIQRGLRNVAEADQLARRLHAAIAEPFSINDQEILISTSVGYAVCPRVAAELDELMLSADQALYRAKNNNGGIEYNGGMMAAAGKLAA